MSNASKSFTSMQATRSHRRDVNGMVGQWSTFNQMRTFLREICVPLQPADPLKSTASAALQNGLMFQPHSESLVVETSNHAVWWTSCLANRSHKGTQKSLGNHRTFTRKMPESSELGGMAQSVGHFVKIPILSDVDVNEVLASRSHNQPGKSNRFPNDLQDTSQNVRIMWHGSVGRTHCGFYIHNGRRGRPGFPLPQYLVAWLSW